MVKIIGELDISSVESVPQRSSRSFDREPTHDRVRPERASLHGQLGTRPACHGRRASRSRGIRNPLPIIRRIIEVTGLSSVLRMNT